MSSSSPREAGIQAAPTERQMSSIRELVADLGLGEEELAELTGVRTPDEIRTSVQASAALDELRRVHDERRPPSAKQQRFVADLVKQAGLTPEAAAALVGAKSLEELTGGREGTASALIDLLQEMERNGAVRLSKEEAEALARVRLDVLVTELPPLEDRGSGGLEEADLLAADKIDLS